MYTNSYGYFGWKLLSIYELHFGIKEFKFMQENVQLIFYK